jgi:outer membrane murein-binding lipoprotein Lpp
MRELRRWLETGTLRRRMNLRAEPIDQAQGASNMLRAVVLTVTVAAGASSTAFAAAPTCQRELAATETSLVQTLVRMRGVAQAAPDTRCAAYQRHIAVMSKAREVFARCKSGRERDVDLGQMDGAIDNAKAVAQDCGGR